ncbi:DNA polymerase Y family protein [Saccharophagus degradans]|uniref:Y-family DNA polymerase n=1 Tax=Saccharophagus degradans TaxID=86304 RepID=UPI0024780FD6|nr:DNA polymerase Y family protein [Saccharophagus degradans]WGO97530.1 DNA polymerase Y family protein [Saccharophagus degradans]
MSSNTTKYNKPRKKPQLWLALQLHQLPLNCCRQNEQPIHSHSNQAIVVVEKFRVTHLTQGAAKLGITTNMPIATAQALGNITQLESTPQKQQQAINILQDICYRFTPYIETQYSNRHTGLLLEISRCLLLFDGVDSLYTQLTQALNRTPFEYKLAFGHTKHAAWLQTFAQSQQVDYSQKILDTLNTLYNSKRSTVNTAERCRAFFIEQLNRNAIHLLHDHPKAIESLDKTGFQTLKDIYNHIETNGLASLSKRLGTDFTEYLAELYDIDQGTKQTSLFQPPARTYQPQETFCQHIQFDYPIANSEQLRQPMQTLLQQLDDFLRNRQQQIQRFYWHLFDIYQNKDTLVVNGNGLSGQHHTWQQLLELSIIQLENKSLAFEVDILELECQHLQQAQHTSQALAFDGKHNNQGSNAFELTLARLQSRLGEHAIYKVSAHDSHIPEHTNVKIPPTANANTQLTPAQHNAWRPSWLLHEPIAIRMHKNTLYWYGQLQLLQGPERIEGHWWDTPTARDYFVAQREDFVRLWVFYDLFLKEWFVQGVF